jgi:cyclopropane fatty-acyl-phospholipid synthase-like methyltransferase
MEKPHAPSCERNRDPILAVLRQHFADRHCVLEIGGGTGQHAVYFANALAHLNWQTSDVAENLPGIRLWLAEAGLKNTLEPIELNVGSAWPEQQPEQQPEQKYDAVFSANTLHIMSWPEVEQLFKQLPRVLSDDAVLAVYGPFNYGGRFTSDSNAAFNQWLQARGAHMAIRDFEAVNELAERIGLRLIADEPMPANNRTLVWRRST